MSNRPGLLSIYKACVHCSENCPEIVNRPKLGLPPRGFWYSQDIQIPLEILVVGKNPGHATPDQSESKYFSSVANDKESLCKAVMSHADRLFRRPEPGFHRTLVRLLRELLGEDELYSRFAITEVVKCQGIQEQGRLHRTTVQTCFDLWLRREIQIFQPRMILALGREAESALRRLLQSPWNERVVYAYHPSYGLRNLIEVKEAWNRLSGKSEPARPSVSPQSVIQPTVARATRRRGSRLNKVFGAPDAERDAILDSLAQLVSGAKTAQRQPVRTDFTEDNKRLLKHYYLDHTKGKRQLAFTALCDLLGEPLGHEGEWSRLFRANYVEDLHFLLGRDPLNTDRQPNDHQNKYFGLGCIHTTTFVVGLNEIFFRHYPLADGF